MRQEHCYGDFKICNLNVTFSSTFQIDSTPSQSYYKITTFFVSPSFPWPDDLRRNYSDWLILLCTMMYQEDQKAPQNPAYAESPDEPSRAATDWGWKHSRRPSARGKTQGPPSKGMRALSACVFTDFAFSGRCDASFLLPTRFSYCSFPLDLHDTHVFMILISFNAAISPPKCAYYWYCSIQRRLS